MACVLLGTAIVVALYSFISDDFAVARNRGIVGVVITTTTLALIPAIRLHLRTKFLVVWLGIALGLCWMDATKWPTSFYLLAGLGILYG